MGRDHIVCSSWDDYHQWNQLFWQRASLKSSEWSISLARLFEPRRHCSCDRVFRVDDGRCRSNAAYPECINRQPAFQLYRYAHEIDVCRACKYLSRHVVSGKHGWNVIRFRDIVTTNRANEAGGLDLEKMALH